MELYNKYRPKTFDDVLGNDLAIKSLRSELKHGAHVFLFTGNGGCGKTTMARCAALELGANELSIREINSSDNRGIDTVREIMEQLRYPPLDNSPLVYILDEFHQQTGAAQEACLKMLEECPEYAYFFICTTNPEKIIKPLLTRCSKIKLQPLDDQTMCMQLRKISHAEGTQIGIDVFKKIAELAQGSSREALKLLSGIIHLENDEERMQYLDTQGVTGENPDVIELCRALIKQAGYQTYMDCLAKCDKDIGNNPESVRMLVMSYMTSVLKKSPNPTAIAALQAFSNADTFRNKKYAIYVAVLDFIDLVG